ncbi:MAG: sugar nucleotide-binding protein [Oceanospirillaceae bacterium]|nr:sugar nucleotide-binding protein [Oceanospirillaceae bacterium]
MVYWGTDIKRAGKLKILLAGCGDIAQRIPPNLPSEYQFFGLTRRSKMLTYGITPLVGDLRDNSCLDTVFAEGFDVVVATLTPDDMSAKGYQKAYVETSAALALAISRAVYKPKLVIWVSSTSVYGQSMGAWVDEDSEARSSSFSGQALRQAEENILAASDTSLVVRFSGIYGPGRSRMLDQVLAGVGCAKQPEQWSNRIHSEDCAAVIAHFMRLNEQEVPLLPIYVATDCQPVTLYEVRHWLAARLNVSLIAQAANTRAARRCSNQKLLDSGYKFKFPTYREGYSALIEDLKSPKP